MTIEETISAIDKLSDLITANIPDIAQEVAVQSKSLVQERIQEFGLNADEAELNAYSEKYAKVRSKKGLQTSHTDLTNTGQMWRGTRTTSEDVQGTAYVVTVSGADNASQEKLDYNSERYGDVLRMSKVEIEKANVLVNEKLQELIKEAGL